MQGDRTRPPIGSSARGDAVTGQPIPPTLGVRLAPAVTFAVSLALYLRTLLPGMAFDDWGELQTVPHVLGISHPTGYPTYILTAWLFELLPIGSVAFRANLLAAVCVAVALAAMTSTTLRLGVRPAIAVAAAVATGAIGTIWGSAVVAEVNGLHLAFIALIVDRSLAWADGRRTRDLALGGLLIGLSLGNHLLTAFVAPFFILFALWEGRSTLLERKRRILAPVLAGLAGLAVYLYIPIAASLSPPLAYNHPTTFEAFRFLVTGEQFRGQYAGLFTVASLGVLADGLPELGATALSAATAVLPILGLVGLAILVVRRPAFGLACAGALLVGIYVWANYLRLPHYLLVPWLLLGIGDRGGAGRGRARGAKHACRVGPVAPPVRRRRSSRRCSRWRWWRSTCRPRTGAATPPPGPTWTPCSGRFRRTPRSSRSGGRHGPCCTPSWCSGSGPTCSSWTTRTSSTTAGARVRRGSPRSSAPGRCSCCRSRRPT